MNRLVLLAVAAVPMLAFGPAQAFTAYVSNEKGNTVSVVDLRDQMKEVATIPVGERPRGITISKDGSRLYVSAPATPTMSRSSTPRRAR